MPEGLYWYHPHVHGEVQAQMLMGLTGAIVVEGPEDDARRAAGIGERILVVRQTQDLDAGKAPAASMTAASPSATGASANRTHAMPATQIDTAHELLCTSNSGIDQLSLNGTPVPLGEAPDDALARLEIAPGGRQIWRILNAATDAFLSLAIIDQDGKALPMQVLARDGSPLTDDAGSRLHPSPSIEAQAVPPAGRIEVLVSAPPAGVKAYLVTHAIDTAAPATGSRSGASRSSWRHRAAATRAAASPAAAASIPAEPAPSAHRDFFSA